MRFGRKKNEDDISPTEGEQTSAGEGAESGGAGAERGGAGEGTAGAGDAVGSEGASAPSTGEQPAGGSTGEDAEVSPEGQRAWLAQLDRKLGTRTYAGAALAVLAVAAGIVAIVLAIDARDNSATKGQFDQIEQQLGEVSERANDTSVEDSLDALTERVDGVEQTLDSASGDEEDIEERLSVVEDDIEELRNDISDLDSGSGSGTGGGGGGTGGSGN